MYYVHSNMCVYNSYMYMYIAVCKTAYYIQMCKKNIGIKYNILFATLALQYGLIHAFHLKTFKGVFKVPLILRVNFDAHTKYVTYQN